MRQQGRWLRRWSVFSLAVVCWAAGSGCLSFVHSLDFPPKDQLAQGELIPAPSRSHVHIFLVHGMDPLDLANLYGLTEYIQQLGYLQTHYGQLYHLWEFKKEMRRIREDDPQARFVLIGFSFGANVARDLANAVKDEGVLIDLLIYMGGNTLENTPQAQPDHVDAHRQHPGGRLYLERGDDGSSGEHSLQQRLALRLTDASADARTVGPRTGGGGRRVPYVEKVPPIPPEWQEEVPMPRRLPPEQVQQLSSQLPPEWSFLNSRTAYREPPPPQLRNPRPTATSDECRSRCCPINGKRSPFILARRDCAVRQVCRSRFPPCRRP